MYTIAPMSASMPLGYVLIRGSHFLFLSGFQLRDIVRKFTGSVMPSRSLLAERRRQLFDDAVRSYC